MQTSTRRGGSFRQPKRGSEEIEKPLGLPVVGQKPGRRFAYAHYPRGWSFDLEHGFLPELCKLTGTPGLNGVGKDGSLSRVLGAVAESGGTLIAPNDGRLGPYQHYCRYYDTEDGGRWYVDFCAEAEVLPTDEIVWNASESVEAFKAFRAHLRDAGIVEPLSVGVYRLLRETQISRVASLRGRSGLNPHLALKADQEQVKLEAMEKAWEEYNASLAIEDDDAPADAAPRRRPAKGRKVTKRLDTIAEEPSTDSVPQDDGE